MSEQYKIVNFHKYCETCKHAKKDGCEEPCNECLNTPAVQYSEKPVKYETKTTK